MQFRQSTWPGLVRTVWEVDPAVAIYLMERFKSPSAHAEVENLVRSNASQVLSAPEALRFLIGDHFRGGQRRELKVTPNPTRIVRKFTLFVSVHHCVGACSPSHRCYVLRTTTRQ